jgi:hypothetical protein
MSLVAHGAELTADERRVLAVTSDTLDLMGEVDRALDMGMAGLRLGSASFETQAQVLALYDDILTHRFGRDWHLRPAAMAAMDYWTGPACTCAAELARVA